MKEKKKNEVKWMWVVELGRSGSYQPGNIANRENISFFNFTNNLLKSLMAYMPCFSKNIFLFQIIIFKRLFKKNYTIQYKAFNEIYQFKNKNELNFDQFELCCVQNKSWRK